MINFFKKEKRKIENPEEIISQFEDLKNNFVELSKKLEDLQKENRFFFQKAGLVRFNPFSEIGGNQSFSLALLDGNDNGVVITSLYTREGNRVYGKPLKKGRSEYLLSEEEKKAIEEAKNSRILDSQPKNRKKSK